MYWHKSWSKQVCLALLSSLRSTSDNVGLELLKLCQNFVLGSVDQVTHAPYLHGKRILLVNPSFSFIVMLSFWHFSYSNHNRAISFMLQSYTRLRKNRTCNVPPPPVVSQSSDTLTMVQGSNEFQWKSTILSLYKGKQEEKNRLHTRIYFTLMIMLEIHPKQLFIKNQEVGQ